MRSSAIVSSVLLAVLVDSSMQEGHSDVKRTARDHSGGGSAWDVGRYGQGFGGGYGHGGYGGFGGYKGNGGGLGGYGGFGGNKGYGGFGGYGGYGGNRGYGGFGGYGGNRGYGGLGGYGSLGADGYGFTIVDTPERYGYESVYPGGHTEVYFLGPRESGQQGFRQGYGYDRQWGSGPQGWNRGPGQEGWNN